MQQTLPRLFNGSQISQRSTDGYINATKMCQATGKKLSDYKRQEATKAYLQELSAVAGIPATELLHSKQGGAPELQGTWIHPQAAIHLAMWCSPAFAVAVTAWVVEWMSGNGHTQDHIPNSKGETIQAWRQSYTRMEEAMLYYRDREAALRNVHNETVCGFDLLEEEVSLLDSTLSAYIDQARWQRHFKSTKEDKAKAEKILNAFFVLFDRVNSIKKWTAKTRQAIDSQYP